MNGSAIQKNVFPDIPSWVLNGRSGSEKKAVIEIANKVISEGQRNDTLFKLACSLRAKDTVKQIYTEAATITDTQQRQSIAK